LADPAWFAGKQVIVTGAATYGEAFPAMATEQIDILRQAGSAGIVLSGLRTHIKDAPYLNRTLELSAREKDVAFTGAPPPTRDYAARLRQAGKALLDKRAERAARLLQNLSIPHPPGPKPIRG